MRRRLRTRTVGGRSVRCASAKTRGESMRRCVGAMHRRRLPTPPCNGDVLYDETNTCMHLQAFAGRVDDSRDSFRSRHLRILPLHPPMAAPVLFFATHEPRVGTSRSRKRHLRTSNHPNLLRRTAKSVRRRDQARNHRLWQKEESANVAAHKTTLLWSRGWLPTPCSCGAAARSSHTREKHSCVLVIDKARRSLQQRSRTDLASKVCGGKERSQSHMRIWLGLLAWLVGLHLCSGKESETCAAHEWKTPEQTTKEDILQRESDHGDNVDVDKHEGQMFGGPVLGYVTPWNSKGYEVALKYRKKLTHVAPVWFQIMPGSPPTLQGRHDVDRGWMESLRQDRTNVPKIMPRFLFEGWSGEQFVDLLQSAAAKGSLARSIADILVQECKQQELDGVVLEVWTQWWAWGLTRHPAAHRAIVSFIAQLYESLKNEGKLLALAVPPAVPAHAQYPAFSADDFRALKSHADLFSTMTYDASNSQQPGPNAPLGWVKSCVEELEGEPAHTKKVLVGVNFYGNDYGPAGVGRPILGHEFLSLLKEHPSSQLEWDESALEHVFTYHVGKVAHRVYYPTIQSLQQRIELARSRGTGLAIWELGQGLESFMDLL